MSAFPSLPSGTTDTKLDSLLYGPSFLRQIHTEPARNPGDSSRNPNANRWPALIGTKRFSSQGFCSARGDPSKGSKHQSMDEMNDFDGPVSFGERMQHECSHVKFSQSGNRCRLPSETDEESHERATGHLPAGRVKGAPHTHGANDCECVFDVCISRLLRWVANCAVLGPHTPHLLYGGGGELIDRLGDRSRRTGIQCGSCYCRSRSRPLPLLFP